jgi:LysR family transcriptional regulator, nod-box dependent transcriptional activator
MRLNRLDLNLLVALNALLSLRSVTGAAQQLHVTQPSMSGSLARLREYFGDPLLVPAGRALKLSPLAEALAVAVREALEKVESAIALRPGFDPATSRHHFRLCASESTVITLLAKVLQRVEAIAPGVTIELLPTDPLLAPKGLQRREIDFVFGVERFAGEEHPHTLVIDDPFTCVVWAQNRGVKRRLTLEQYLSMKHVVTRYGFERTPGFEQWSLEQMGLTRREDVTCTTPALMGPLVVGTRRVATMPTQLARVQAGYLPLKLLPPPMKIAHLRIAMQWHQSRQHDGAFIWFREQVLAVATVAA